MGEKLAGESTNYTFPRERNLLEAEVCKNEITNLLNFDAIVLHENAPFNFTHILVVYIYYITILHNWQIGLLKKLLKKFFTNLLSNYKSCVNILK